MAFDIEVSSDDGFPYPEQHKHPIISISMYDFNKGIYYLLALKDYDKTKNKIDIDPSKIRFKKCETEAELLRLFIKIVRSLDIDFLFGWNSEGFDFPYLIKRSFKIIGDETKQLSPFGNVSCKNSKKLNRMTGKEETYFISKIDGIVLLDYMHLYKKYIFEPRESYSLDFISTTELGEGKVDYSEFDNLHDMWINNPQKFLDYNIVDVQLIYELDQKLGLIDLNSSITYKAKCNHVDTMGTIKVWEAFLYNEMLKINLCLPPRKEYEKESYPGAYVKEPIKGLYGYGFSVDFDSLYPITMRQYQISPETFVPELTIDVDQTGIDDKFFEKDFKNPNDDFILTGSGNYFRKDKEGIIPNIVGKLFNERKQVKKSMIGYKKEFEETKNSSLKSKISQSNNEQMAIKILLNSLYGSMANKHFIFYDIRFARSITLSAQLTTKFTEKFLNEQSLLKKYNITSVYCDTDSIYFDCDKMIQDFIEQGKLEDDEQKITNFIDKFVNIKIQPLIKDACQKLADQMSATNYNNASREKIYKSGFWVGKKKYCTLTIDNEGVRYKEPKLSVTGIEIVRSSTPAVVKPMLKETIIKILEGKDVSKYIHECKELFDTYTSEQIAFPRSANNIDKWIDSIGFKKGTPIGVRAAIVYNNYVDKQNIETYYPKIQTGEKIKFLYMKQPNVLSENVCGFIRRMPEELKRYTDYNMMWEKAFIAVIDNICEKINVNYKPKQVSLSDLF